MKKVWKIILIIIILFILIIAGYFGIIKLQEKIILNKLDEIFVALKKGEVYNLKQYFKFDELSNQEDILEVINNNEKIVKAVVSNLNYEVIDKDIKLNNCKIRLKISNKDLNEVCNKCFSKVITLAVSQKFGLITVTEKNQKLKEYIIEQLNSDSIDVIINEVEIVIAKEDESWKINYDKEQLMNAILPGYKEVIKYLKLIK